MAIMKLSVSYQQESMEPTTNVQIVAEDWDYDVIAARAAERDVTMTHHTNPPEHAAQFGDLQWLEYDVSENDPHDLFYAVWGQDARPELADDFLRHLLTLCCCEYDYHDFI